MRVTPHLAAVCLLAGGALTACGGDETEVTVSGPVIVQVVDESDTMAAALIEGVLELRDGCLYVGDGLLALGTRATWDAARQRVDFEDGASWLVGDEITAGGGSYSTVGDAADVFADEAVDALRACTGTADQPVTWGTPS